MAKPPKRNGQPWSAEDVQLLKKEIKENTPTRVLGLHLERSPTAVQKKASALGLSLKPVNQSPR